VERHINMGESGNVATVPYPIHSLKKKTSLRGSTEGTGSKKGEINLKWKRIVKMHKFNSQRGLSKRSHEGRSGKKKRERWWIQLSLNSEKRGGGYEIFCGGRGVIKK